MEDQKTEVQTSDSLQASVRPTFITVLCILTFIGSGFGLWDATTDYLGAKIAVDAIDMADSEMNDALEDLEDAEVSEGVLNFFEGMIGNIQENMTVEKIRRNALGVGFSCLLTLAGAMLMWFLNKKGFYLYLIGIVIYIVTPMLVFDGTMAALQASSSAFIGIVFIILYGVNVKHLK